MRVAAVIGDLLLFSRIEAAASAAGADLVRVDSPAQLTSDLDLVLVEWTDRRPDWADALSRRPGGRVILFGRHTDLEAHAAARAADLGPMWARSKLVAELSSLFGTPATDRGT